MKHTHAHVKNSPKKSNLPNIAKVIQRPLDLGLLSLITTINVSGYPSLSRISPSLSLSSILRLYKRLVSIGTEPLKFDSSTEEQRGIKRGRFAKFLGLSRRLATAASSPVPAKTTRKPRRRRKRIPEELREDYPSPPCM